MSNLYKPENKAGTSYVRAREVVLYNGENSKNIRFVEEKVLNMDDGEVIRQNYNGGSNMFMGELSETVTDADMGKTINLLNPVDGTSLGTVATYAEFYTIMYSLYMQMAAERDQAIADQIAAREAAAAAEAAAAQPEPEPEPAP